MSTTTSLAAEVKQRVHSVIATWTKTLPEIPQDVISFIIMCLFNTSLLTVHVQEINRSCQREPHQNLFIIRINESIGWFLSLRYKICSKETMKQSEPTEEHYSKVIVDKHDHCISFIRWPYAHWYDHTFFYKVSILLSTDSKGTEYEIAVTDWLESGYKITPYLPVNPPLDIQRFQTTKYFMSELATVNKRLLNLDAFIAKLQSDGMCDKGREIAIWKEIYYYVAGYHGKRTVHEFEEHVVYDAFHVCDDYGVVITAMCAMIGRKVSVPSTPSTIEMIVVEEGDGEIPPHYTQQESRVSIQDVQYLKDGKKYIMRNSPWIIGRNQMLIGLQEAVCRMKVGTRAMVWVSADWAYGVTGDDFVVPDNCDFTVDIKLNGIE